MNGGYFRRDAKHSWHKFVTFTRAGQVLARCGWRMTGTPEWSDDPPLNEKGCESCSRGQLRDEAHQVDVADEVAG